MSTAPSLFAAASAEIVELHDFFVAWFLGDAVAAPDFGRFDAVMHGNFTMMPPDGAPVSLVDVAARVRAARGAASPGYQIVIEDIRPVWESGDDIIVSYVEAQQRDGRWNRRRSSVLFSRLSTAPHGVEWRYLQETWMQLPE